MNLYPENEDRSTLAQPAERPPTSCPLCIGRPVRFCGQETNMGGGDTCRALAGVIPNRPHGFAWGIPHGWPAHLIMAFLPTAWLPNRPPFRRRSSPTTPYTISALARIRPNVHSGANTPRKLAESFAVDDLNGPVLRLSFSSLLLRSTTGSPLLARCCANIVGVADCALAGSLRSPKMSRVSTTAKRPKAPERQTLFPNPAITGGRQTGRISGRARKRGWIMAQWQKLVGPA